jgi:hypothetical protein
MSGDADRDVDDSPPRPRREVPANRDRMFASVPSSSELAARLAERERRLAEQGRRLKWEALEQMCRRGDLNPHALAGTSPSSYSHPNSNRCAASCLAPDLRFCASTLELARIIDGARCTQDPRSDTS